MESCIRRGLSEGIRYVHRDRWEVFVGDSGLDGIGSGCCQIKRSGPVKVWTGEVYEERCIRRVIPGQNSVDRVGWRIMSREVGGLRTVSEL